MKASLTKVQTLNGVAEYRLHNGLRVLYRQEKSAPVVAVCVTFHVGSRNEAKGHTGATHILEHLLFKDSKNFNKGNGKDITGYLEWFGALLNASTWLDRTNYYELIPKEHIEETLFLEADRMRNSLFNDSDLASEMTIVRNEYERTRNEPFELLDEEMTAKAFIKHPYRIPTIGTKEDIEGSTAKKLREFYDQFYWPNNATLSIIGDVSWPDAKRYVLKYFGPIPRSPKPIPKLTIREPKQVRARSVVMRQPLGIGIASLMYKAPKGTHADYPALTVAAAILGNGFSSRLRKALVDTGLAADVSVSAHPQHDPGLITFTAHVADQVAPQSVLALMRNEIADFIKTGPTDAELERARVRLLSEMSAERDGVLNETRAVSEAIAAGDWRLAYQFGPAIQALTPAHVRRIGRKYLIPQTETSGMLLNEHE